MKAFICNGIIEIIYSKKLSSWKNPYVRIHGNKILNKETGEISEYTPKTHRILDANSLSKSFAELRRLINNNFEGKENEKHFTLTYKDEILDYSIAVDDFKKFWKRFLSRYPESDYIRIVEPQESGRWHIHVLVKSNHPSFANITEEHLSKIWKNGRVSIRTIENVQNIGAYFSPSMSKKKERLRYYPANFQFYTSSKGIIKAEAVKVFYGDIRSIMENTGEANLFIHYSVEIDGEEDGEFKVFNTYTYEQYHTPSMKKEDFDAELWKLKEDEFLSAKGNKALENQMAKVHAKFILKKLAQLELSEEETNDIINRMKNY